MLGAKPGYENRVVVSRGDRAGNGRITYTKYSNASPSAWRISCRSRAMRTRLVGSMLYGISEEISRSQGYTPVGGGETLSGTGPMMRDGQMIESAFSKCKVRSLPEPVCNDSSEEKEEA